MCAWDISLVRFYKIQGHYKGSCILYLYPGDELNFYKPKLHQLTDPVTSLFLLNFSTRRRATGGQFATLERNFDVWF